MTEDSMWGVLLMAMVDDGDAGGDVERSWEGRVIDTRADLYFVFADSVGENPFRLVEYDLQAWCFSNLLSDHYT